MAAELELLKKMASRLKRERDVLLSAICNNTDMLDADSTEEDNSELDEDLLSALREIVTQKQASKPSSHSSNEPVLLKVPSIVGQSKKRKAPLFSADESDAYEESFGEELDPEAAAGTKDTATSVTKKEKR